MYAIHVRNSLRNLQAFETALEDLPILQPVIWGSFSPAKAYGSDYDEHYLYSIIAGLHNRISRRLRTSTFPIFYFAGVESNPEDPRIRSFILMKYMSAQKRSMVVLSLKHIESSLEGCSIWLIIIIRCGFLKSSTQTGSSNVERRDLIPSTMLWKRLIRIWS